MAARIFCKTGALRGKAFEIGLEATVGSAPDNAIVLSATTISKRHARIFFDSERHHYVIEDLGSSNGTRVDGVSVRGDERLDDLNVITFAGSHDFIFQRLAEGQVLPAIEPSPSPPQEAAVVTSEETRSEATAEIIVPEFDGEPAEATVEGPPGRVAGSPRFVEEPTRVVLELELSDGRWTRFELVEGANVLGRSRACRITVDNDKLSRQHALLTVTAGSVRVKDLETTNRTYVDGVQATAETGVEADTELRFGPIRGRVLWEA